MAISGSCPTDLAVDTMLELPSLAKRAMSLESTAFLTTDLDR